MTDAVHPRGGSAAPVSGGVSPRILRVTKRVTSTALLLLGIAALALSFGFVRFAERAAGALPPADARADGIVVLTGGSARIDGALQLLAEGRGGRLLISGVNPVVTRRAIGVTLDKESRRLLRCCADLDHRAEDTVGNAVQTRRWADRQGFASLIVVTSDYHMPRSMAELAEAMPNRELIAFPISSSEVRLADWWRDPEAFSLLVREYGKFLLAEARQTLAPAPAMGAARSSSAGL
jgi:uncharacterized SAM-binding protein YcdF (DUF218 family)